MIVEVVCLAASLLVTAVAIPMYAGIVPPNRWYGYRAPRSMSNAESWYAANRIAGRDLFVGSLTSAVVLLLLLTADHWNAGAATWLPLVIFAAAILGAVAHSLWCVERPRSSTSQRC